MTSEPTSLEKTRQALKANEIRDAVRELRAACREPTFADVSSNIASAAEILAIISACFDDHELVQLARSVAADADRTQKLYDLGFALYERQAFDVGIAMLEHANTISPAESPIVTELVASLHAEGRYDRALAVLRAADLVDDFYCRYQFAYTHLMLGDLPEAAKAAAMIRPADDDERGLAHVVGSMIARADSVRHATPLDTKDLRGWHFVTAGAILLHLSPFGFDEGMQGRYAFTTDSYENIRRGIVRAGLALKALGHTPTRILALEDRASRAVAEAASMILDVPLAPADDGPGLVVAYDLALIDNPDVDRLSKRRPDQWLFAHVTRWRESFPFTADLTTMLAQTCVAPWDEKIRIEPGMQSTTKIPPDNSDAPTLAAHIVRASPPGDELAPNDSEADLIRFCESAREWFGVGDERASLPRGGGPVKSSYFL